MTQERKNRKLKFHYKGGFYTTVFDIIKPYTGKMDKALSKKNFGVKKPERYIFFFFNFHTRPYSKTRLNINHC